MTLRPISYTVLQEHHQQKRHDSQFPPLDLSRCDLEGFDLRDLDLGGANLSGADLTGAILGNTNLRHTILHQTRFADISLGALVAAGIEPVALFEQHRGATYYLLRLFHFSPTPEPRRTFALTSEDCLHICQVHATLLWQDLDNQAIISALYPGRIWEDWLIDTALRPILDWVMAHPEYTQALHKIIADRHYYASRRLRYADLTTDVDSVLADIKRFAQGWERKAHELQQREQEEAMGSEELVAYPLAPWSDGPSVRQIKSRMELVTVLKANSYYTVDSLDVWKFEYECLHEGFFLYYVGEPGQPDSPGLIVKILPDGSVGEMTDQYLRGEVTREPRIHLLPDGSFDEVLDQGQDLAPLAAWLKEQRLSQTDLSPLGRACHLLSRAGIAKLIYQIYWYYDEDQVDFQSCLDEQGNEVPSNNPTISRAYWYWLLHYENREAGASEDYGRYELIVEEKRLTRLGDAQIPELEEDHDVFEGEA